MTYPHECTVCPYCGGCWECGTCCTSVPTPEEEEGGDEDEWRCKGADTLPFPFRSVMHHPIIKPSETSLMAKEGLCRKAGTQ